MVQETGKAVEVFRCDEADARETIIELLLLRGGQRFKGNIYLDGEVVVLGDHASVWSGMSLERAQTPRGLVGTNTTETAAAQEIEGEIARGGEDTAEDDTMDVESEILLGENQGDVAEATSLATQLLLQAHAHSARLFTEANQRLYRSLEESNKRIIEHSIEQSSASMAALREQGLALQNTVSEINLRVAKERVYSAQMAEHEERAKVAQAQLFALQHANLEHPPEKPGLFTTLAQGLMYSLVRSQQRKLNK